MSLKEIPQLVSSYTPWIVLTTDDFDSQFGEGIRVRLTNAIKARFQAREQTHKVVTTFSKNSMPISLPSPDKYLKPAQDEFERRFKSKVLTFSDRIRHSLMQGFQGDVEKFNKVDPNSPYLRGILLDLLAYEFLKEVGECSQDESLMLERGRQILKQMNDWEKGLEAVRLLSMQGEWIDSHGKAISYG